MKMQKDICPVCGSDDIEKSYYYNSIYGYLDQVAKDICHRCGFKSSEPFSIINFRNLRDNKINNIINNKENGI